MRFLFIAFMCISMQSVKISVHVLRNLTLAIKILLRYKLYFGCTVIKISDC